MIPGRKCSRAEARGTRTAQSIALALISVAGFACNPDPRGRCDNSGQCRSGSACNLVDHLCEAVAADAGSSDAGIDDAGIGDGGIGDGGSDDAGASDAGASDAGASDAGASDAGADGGDAGPVFAFDPGGGLDGGALDFGSVDCGATAAARSISIVNLGGGGFSYTASLSLGASSPYQIADGGDGARVTTSNPATITIAPLPIPASVASLPASFDDRLVISTDIPGASAAVVPLSEAAQGAILAFDVANISFGPIPAGSSQSSAFQLSNSGNLAAPVLLFDTDAGVFEIDPSSMQTLDAGSSLSGAVIFHAPASSATRLSDAVTLSVPGGTPLCQPLPSIPVSGTAANGAVALSAIALNFGAVDCGQGYSAVQADGGTTRSQSFTLANSGNAAMSFSARLRNGLYYQLDCAPEADCGEEDVDAGFSGTLSPGDTATFTVTPAPIPSSSATTADLYGDEIELSTDVVGDSGHVVTLSETASGAVLSFDSSELDFGGVPVNTTASQPFHIVNSGNAAASATLSSSNAEFSVPSGASAIGGGSSPAFAVSFSPGSDVSAQSGNVTLAVDSNTVLCAPLPADPLVVTGSGTNGVVAFSPSALDFNGGTTGVNCGAQARSQTITFTNLGNQSYTLAGTLDAGTAYNFSIAPSSGLVAADGGTATVTVSPLAIPSISEVPGSYGDTLTMTTTVSGDSPHLIPLVESARGVILQNFNPANGEIAFNSVGIGGQSIYQLYVQNAGSVAATLAISSGNPSIFSFDQPIVGASSGGGPTGVNFNAYFNPTVAQSYSSTAIVGVAPGTVLCQPLPSFLSPGSGQSLTLSGTATDASTFFASPTAIDLQGVPCGTAASAQSIKLSNTSASAVAWSAGFSGGGAALYKLSLTSGGAAISSGSVAANSSSTIFLVPATIPIAAGTSTAPNAYGANLTISGTGSSSGLAPIEISIDETAEGAVLSFNPSSESFALLQCTGGTTMNAAVVNNGNLSAAVKLSLSGDSNSELSEPVRSGNVAQSGGQLPFTVTCSSLLAPAESASVNLTSTSTLCTPLPSMTVTTK